MFADTFIIIVNLLDFVPLGLVAHHFLQRCLQAEVIDAATASAEEVGVRGGDGVVTSVALVDGQGLCRALVGQQLQGIIDRGLREGGNGGCKRRVNLVHGGVVEMMQQVVHDGYPLHGGLYVVTDESVECIHRSNL